MSGTVGYLLKHVASQTRRQIGYVRGLQPGTEYEFRVTAIGPRGRRCVSLASSWIRTLDSGDQGERPTGLVEMISIRCHLGVICIEMTSLGGRSALPTRTLLDAGACPVPAPDPPPSLDLVSVEYHELRARANVKWAAGSGKSRGAVVTIPTVYRAPCSLSPFQIIHVGMQFYGFRRSTNTTAKEKSQR